MKCQGCSFSSLFKTNNLDYFFKIMYHLLYYALYCRTLIYSNCVHYYILHTHIYSIMHTKVFI